jgi:hypothetical protein
LVAGYNNGALKRSDDGGLTWSPLSTALLTPPVPMYNRPGEGMPFGRNTLVQDPVIPTRWYLGTGFFPAVSENNGLDGWRMSAFGVGEVSAGKAQFFPGRPDMIVFPASDLNAVVVTDGGASGDAEFAIRARAPGGNLHTAHGVGVFINGDRWISIGTHYKGWPQLAVSTDDGLTFDTRNRESVEGREKEMIQLPLYLPITGGVVAPDNPDEFLLLCGVRPIDASVGKQAGVYRTTDGGVSFAPYASFPWEDEDDAYFGSPYGSRDAFYADSRPARINYRYLWVQNQGLAISSDRGVNWTALPLPEAGRRFGNMTMNRDRPGELWVMLHASSPAGLSSPGRTLWRLPDAADPTSTWEMIGDFSAYDDRMSIDVIGDRVVIYAQRSNDTHSRW